MPIIGTVRRHRVALLTEAHGPGISLANALSASEPAGYAIDVLPLTAAGPRSLVGYDLAQLVAANPQTARLAVEACTAQRVPFAVAYHPALDPQLYRYAAAALSPGLAADAELLAGGVAPHTIHRLRLAVEPDEFHPSRYNPAALGSDPALCAGRINLLHAGPLGDRDELTLLAAAFIQAHDRDCRLHLVFTGDGPERDWLASVLGPATSLIGPLRSARLAGALATADLLVFTGDDPFGESIVAAQASGLPVLAVEGGAAADLIESGRSGCVVPAGTLPLAEAIRWLARRAPLRERLITGGRRAARGNTVEQTVAQLTRSWTSALAGPAGEVARAA
jgi:glycosyltransferase involved in cell wall biosynthesis